MRQLQPTFQLFSGLGFALSRNIPLVSLVCALGVLTNNPVGLARASELTIASDWAKLSNISQANGTASVTNVKQPALEQPALLGQDAAQLKQSLPKQVPQGFPSDGIYLYGQLPEPEQLGVAYMVFEVRQGRAVGAFYMPQSSFDCFYGQVQTNQLALTVVNSYDRQAHNFEIALQSNSTVAGNRGSVIQGLAGYHRLADLSANDRRILNVCRSQYQEKI